MKPSIEEQFAVYANMMTSNCYDKMDDKFKLQFIFDTEEGLFVPKAREKDYNWLSRNFMIKNKNHPLATVVMNLLKNILKKEAI